jgi:hypothetical protein
LNYDTSTPFSFLTPKSKFSGAECRVYTVV